MRPSPAAAFGAQPDLVGHAPSEDGAGRGGRGGAIADGIAPVNSLRCSFLWIPDVLLCAGEQHTTFGLQCKTGCKHTWMWKGTAGHRGGRMRDAQGKVCSVRDGVPIGIGKGRRAGEAGTMREGRVSVWACGGGGGGGGV